MSENSNKYRSVKVSIVFTKSSGDQKRLHEGDKTLSEAKRKYKVNEAGSGRPF